MSDYEIEEEDTYKYEEEPDPNGYKIQDEIQKETSQEPRPTTEIPTIHVYGPQASIISITGKRHSGKSYMLRNLLILLFPFFIMWDVNHEHQFENVPITYKLDDIQGLYERYHRVVYRPLDKSEFAFNRFVRTCNNLSDFMLVIEEVERYATIYHMPEPLAWTVDSGRHRGIGLCMTLRRPSQCHKNILSNSDFVFMFHQHLPLDIDYLVNWVGQEAYGLKDIQEFGFMVYSDHEGRIIGEYKI